MKNKSYFALNKELNPLVMLDRWLNPYKHLNACMLDGKEVSIALTTRAQRALEKREQRLIAEMQLYFSCMVKKRVLFHDQTDQTATSVNRHLDIVFRCVQSDACNPEEFADHLRRTRGSTSA